MNYMKQTMEDTEFGSVYLEAQSICWYPICRKRNDY